MTVNRFTHWVLAMTFAISHLPNPSLFATPIEAPAESLGVEDKIHLALVGPGTDEALLFQALEEVSGSYEKTLRMERKYRDKYGDLVSDLRRELTVAEYQDAMVVLSPALKNIAFRDSDEEVVRKVRSVVPHSLQMVDNAIAVLSQGWAALSPEERSLVLRLYDPGNTGEVDEAFVEAVLGNYQRIREEFDAGLVMEVETEASMCVQHRLYYITWKTIHVCPYFKEESNADRMARDLLHEVVHQALLVVDRPYFSHDSAEYTELTPLGPWANQLPVVGIVFRELAHSDTLYHPDAYAFFAFLLP